MFNANAGSARETDRVLLRRIQGDAMYCDKNFKTKKALRQAVTKGEAVSVYQPGPFGSGCIDNGLVTVEGPHYPAPHTWYARVRVVGGRVVAVK